MRWSRSRFREWGVDTFELGLCSDWCDRKLSAKNIKVVRPTLFNYIYTREEFEKYTNELWQMMIHAKFNIKIHEVYPLKDVARAHTVSRIPSIRLRLQF